MSFKAPRRLFSLATLSLNTHAVQHVSTASAVDIYITSSKALLILLDVIRQIKAPAQEHRLNADQRLMRNLDRGFRSLHYD